MTEDIDFIIKHLDFNICTNEDIIRHINNIDKNIKLLVATNEEINYYNKLKKEYKIRNIMEKKQGTICIVNRAIFITDDNHPDGFTIPVNTRLIIDAISKDYFRCTLDSGYKTSIELEHDCSLTIITDNKKINKFKQQLAENNQPKNNNFMIKLDFNICNYTDILDAIDTIINTSSANGLTNIDREYLKELRVEKNLRDSKTMEESVQSNKTVTKRKIYTVEVLEFSDGSSEMNRTNNGFNINELMGLSSLISYEMLDTYRGIIKPDVIHRTAIID